MRHVPWSLMLLGLVLAHASPTQADVAPPVGIKRIAFEFDVKGVASHPERVLFAYPCGDSNGAPIVQHRKIEEGKKISVGRRGGTCAIYSVDKATYDTWAKGYTPTPNALEDVGLEALAKQSTKCTGAAPNPTFEVKIIDPRKVIEQSLSVTALDATQCVLASDESRAPTSRGCLGCTVAGDGGSSVEVGLLVVGLLGLVTLRRRSQ